MSIDQLYKIDFISTMLNGKVLLTISDHHEWDEKGQHILLLQEKINAYLQFIESGQIFNEYPKARNRKIIIEAFFKFSPPAVFIPFLDRFEQEISKLGFSFRWRNFKPGLG